jgi:hypothetical protein
VRTFDEAMAAARGGSPFSNNTAWEIWSYNWCDRCVHDKGTRDGTDECGCPLVTVALCGKTPSEWLEKDPLALDRYTCVEFRDEDDPGPSEPQPVPDPPGQELLLPREPYEATRMLTVEPAREAVDA